MKYRTRIYYTEEQKALMWDRWQAGESLSSIARLFDRPHSSVEGIVKQTGGFTAAAASRLPGGSSARILMRRTFRCQTRPSIKASSSELEIAGPARTMFCYPAASCRRLRL